jgi:hypothetical protein
MFMPTIMIAMVKKVPPIPTKVMVTPKDMLSMRVSFQPREHVTGCPMDIPALFSVCSKAEEY